MNAGLLVSLVRLAPADAGPDRLYVTNSSLRERADDANIARFDIAASGAIAQVDTADASEGGRGIVFTPAVRGRRFAYAPSELANSIDFYRVDRSGRLTLAGSTETPQPFGIAIAPDGSTVYVPSLTGSLSAFHVTSSGKLKPLNTVDTGQTIAKGVAVTSSGRFIYVTHSPEEDGGVGAVTGFELRSNGSIGRQVANVPAGPSGHRAIITPDDRFLYITNQVAESGPDVAGFRIDASGELTPVPGSPFEGGVWTEGTALSPDGTKLFITALGAVGDETVRDGQVRGFSIGADGRLVEIERVDIGSDPVDLAFGRDGAHLYVSDFSDDTVTIFHADTAGNLDRVDTVPSGGVEPGFQSVVVLPGS